MNESDAIAHFYVIASGLGAPSGLSLEGLLRFFESFAGNLQSTATQHGDPRANSSGLLLFFYERLHEAQQERNALLRLRRLAACWGWKGSDDPEDLIKFFKDEHRALRSPASAVGVMSVEPPYDEAIAARDERKRATSPEVPSPGTLLERLQALAPDDDPAENCARHLDVLYTNHRGVTAPRHVRPLRLWFGSTEHHPRPQWLLTVATEKGARDFALAGLHAFGEAVMTP